DVFVGSVNGGIVTLVDGNGSPVNLGDVKPEALSFIGVNNVSGNVVTFASSDLLTGVKPGMTVSGPGIPDGTMVLAVNGAVVTLDIGSGTLGDVTELTFGSTTSIGGSMNNLAQTATGIEGKDGNDAWVSNPIFGDGEGEDGYSGGGGGDGTAGAGGAG